MFYEKRTIAAIAVGLLSVPLASAAQCKAKASTSSNSMGFGPGGTTEAKTDNFEIYKDDKMIYSADKFAACEKGATTFDTHGELDHTFKFWSDCDSTDLKKCYGHYDDNDDLQADGEEDKNFYGLGMSILWWCTIEFDC